MNGLGAIKPVYTTSATTGVDDEQTVTFRDGTEQWTTEIRSHMDPTRMIANTPNMSLGDFMSRPLKIATYAWDPAAVTPLFQNFNPWTLFFENPNVINRINNFALMSCKLHVKFLINGNSFYYGRLMADYIIRPTEDFVSSRSGAITKNIIQASQRLHLFIDPSLSQAGTMVLPMLIQPNMMSVPAADWRTNGQINIRQMQPLKHANGAIDTVLITVFAHATDVILTQPTSTSTIGLVPQAGDEYGAKPISSLMSSVAKAAGSLQTIPWIGPYAKATQMVTSGVGKVASLFGYSRPAILDNQMPVRRYVLGNLANTDRGDTVTKLTVDSKQELTVDPSVIGVDVEDELVIKHIASTESYITQFPFTTAGTTGDVLFSAKVCPVHSATDSGFLYNPACTFAVTPFKYWRGRMRYRFQIVASAFHKGRLLISYDPVNSANLRTNLQYSKIIDLSNERDFTIDVCWTQPYTFLPTPALGITAQNYVIGGLSTGDITCNGTLTVSIMNELTSPNSSVNNDIAINVFVSAGDDFEVAVPTSPFKTYSYLPPAGTAPQMGDVDGTGATDDSPEQNAPIMMEAKECVGEQITPDNTLDVYFGESISSFRQLLKRYTVHGVYPLLGVDNTLTNIDEFDFPVYRGFGPDARHVVTGPVNANIVNTTLLNYLAPAFFAYRGSMRSKYVLFNGGASGSTLSVARNNTLANFAVGSVLPDYTNAGKFASTYLTPYQDGFSGRELTQTAIQPSVEVELPFYSYLRFFQCRRFSRTVNASFVNLMHTLTVLLSPYGTAKPYIERHVSIGEDFQLILFQGQPPVLPSVTLTPT